jgi:hypothetical protein
VWSPPTEKTIQELWDLGENPDGLLTFNFTIDPITFKKDMTRLAREASSGANPDKSAAATVIKPMPGPKEIISL